MRPIREALLLLRVPAELKVEPSGVPTSKRLLPLGMVVSVWLRASVLGGTALVAIALIVIVASIKHGQLPTFLSLMIDKQVARGEVDNAQRRQVTKSKGIKVTHWTVNYHFSLPDGQILNGESTTSSTSLKKGAIVQVEYSKSRPQANRIQGMSARSDQNNLTLFGLGLLAVASFVGASGLLEAWKTIGLLQTGLLGEATVTHCIDSSAVATHKLNGLRWKSKGPRKEIALAEFQRQILEQHGSQFDSAGQFVGTSGARRLNVALAMWYGALMGAFIACVVTINLLGGPIGWAVLGGAILGAGGMAAAEMRWRFLLKSSVKFKSEDSPARFQKVLCALRCPSFELAEPMRLERTLDLKGDSSDASPHSVLYLPGKSSSAKFLDDLQLRAIVGSNGEHTIISRAALTSLKLLAVILSVGLLGICLAWLI